MNRILLFGTGDDSKALWNKIESYPSIFQDHYLGFTDNNPQKWNGEFFGKKIYPSQMIPSLVFDYVVIASNSYEAEIREQLVGIFKLSNAQILKIGEYEKKCVAEWMTINRKGNFQNGNLIFDTKKIVVYTAITGDYDTLKEPEFVDAGITYVCFTNSRKLKSKIWNIELVKDSELDDMHLAKKIKIFPNQYLPDFKTSVWVDGKFKIRNDFREYIKTYGGVSPMLCFLHPERQCIYEEVATCIFLGRGRKEELVKQLAAYYVDGYPFHQGLYENGCIVRNSNDRQIIKLMSSWWEQIQKYSYRDQISLPYVCWKQGFSPDICGLNINKNRWLNLCRHLK